MTYLNLYSQSNTESGDETFSSSVIACGKKPYRMSSTPTKASKKQSKMLQFSVSIIDNIILVFEFARLDVGSSKAQYSKEPFFVQSCKNR